MLGFIRSVENLLPFLGALQGTPFEKVWIQAIRGKIIGSTDQVLKIYGTPLDWGEIKNNLQTGRCNFDERVSITADR